MISFKEFCESKSIIDIIYNLLASIPEVDIDTVIFDRTVSWPHKEGSGYGSFKDEIDDDGDDDIRADYSGYYFTFRIVGSKLELEIFEDSSEVDYVSAWTYPLSKWPKVS